MIIAVATIAFALVQSASVRALPAGRAWSPVERLSLPQLVLAGAVRLEVSSNGLPNLIAAATFDTSLARPRWLLLAWDETAWRVEQISSFLTASFPWPYLSSTDRRYLVAMARPGNTSQTQLIVSEIGDGAFMVPDTAMQTPDEQTEFAGAASALRRWVVRSEAAPNATFLIRTVYSDAHGAWTELPKLGADEDHCTIAPLDDRSAMVAYAGQSGLAWARCVDGAWIEQGSLDSRPFVAAHPRMRLRPSGGLWMLWTEHYRVHVSTYGDGQWQRGDSLTCAHPDSQLYWSAWCDASRDPAERPLLVWSDLGVGYNYRDIACIAWPTETGWTQGEEIPGSEQNATLPVVTRDLNGDAWVAWQPIGVGNTYYTHTYSRATSGAPRLAGSGPQRTVAWTLSELAPETWWVVLRSVNGGPFESAARVRAGSSLEMSWTDTPPSANLLAYKIRRECVDTRYVWESPVATLGASSRPPIYLGPPQQSPGDGGESGATDTPGEKRPGGLQLTLTGAEPGPLAVKIYDLQGRQVFRHSATASGGQEPFAFDLAEARRALAMGVYFLRVTDATGRASNAVRFVILK